MSETTTNLELFKYNPNTDGDQTFNIDEALNNNFDKLDTVIGALANLTTTQKANLVAAINEIITKLGGKAAKDLSNLDSIGQGILDAKIEAEALTAQNGYIKFKLNGISNLIICWAHAEFNNIATGISTKTITLPISMYINGESVSTGTRSANIMITAYNYNNVNRKSSTYTVGFHNSTNSTQAVNVYIVVFGTE